MQLIEMVRAIADHQHSLEDRLISIQGQLRTIQTHLGIAEPEAATPPPDDQEKDFSLFLSTKNNGFLDGCLQCLFMLAV